MLKKKKIVFVINSLGCGGAEKSLVSLLPLIDYDKYDVCLQMFNIGGTFMDLLPDEVKILEERDFYKFLKLSLKEQLALGNLKFMKARITLTLDLKKNRKKANPAHDTEVFWNACGKAIDSDPDYYDVAIAWGQGNPTHYVAEKVNAARKFAWINANYELTGHNRDFDKPYYEVYDKIVSVSDELLELSRQVFPEYKSKMLKILDIQNEKLIQEMAKLPDDDLSEKKSGKVRLVTVGRLNKQKGYDLAVEAAKILDNNGIDFEWYFVGEGGFREEIESMLSAYKLKEKIRLVGVKSNPYPYIASADIYVQTTRSEGYCLTLAEARTLNKPIVTTNFDVVYAQMIHEKNGLIVEMNKQAIADGIIRLINDKELRLSLINYLKTEKKGNLEEFLKFEKLLENESCIG